MYKHLDVMMVDQDPAVIMAAHLSLSGNKYERALCKTLQKISICHSDHNKFPIPECPELFQVILTNFYGVSRYFRVKFKFWLTISNIRSCTGCMCCGECMGLTSNKGQHKTSNVKNSAIESS